MEQLLITVEDIKNELDISIADELNLQPRQVNKWIMRQQQTILNHIVSHVDGGIGQLEIMLQDDSNAKVVRAALIEQINYIAVNNFVQPNNVMNVDGQQIVEPTISPLARLMLLNAGLMRKEDTNV